VNIDTEDVVKKASKQVDILKKQLPFRIREAADPGPLEAKQFHTCTYASKEFYGIDETVKIGRYSSEFDKIQADLGNDTTTPAI
jgi:hypothetical protein